ncbi:MAG: hypothetical protein WBQ85_13550 [Candidatus Sulfotelmatobacter sp.]
MSVIAKLIIGGWLATGAMIGCCAACESGKLVRSYRRIGEWLGTFNPSGAGSPKEGLQLDREDMA